VAERRFERFLHAAGPLPIVTLLFGIAAAFMLLSRGASQQHGVLAATLADLKPIHAGVSVDGARVQWLRRVSLDDKVVTDADGRARLRLDDGTSAVLDRDTTLVVTAKGFRLEQGRAHLISPTGSHPLIELGGMSVLLSGSSAGLERRGDKISAFSADGELTVRGPDGKEQLVSTGETARLNGGAVKVAPERTYDDWTHGLAKPWAARGAPRRTVGELWGSAEGDEAGSAGSPLTIRAHTVTAIIDRELARTTTETTFFNAGSSTVSGDFRIALPPGALVSSFAIERGGSREQGQIALAARAKQELRSSGGVLEWAGDGWLRGTLPGISAGEELKVEIKYAEWLSPRKHADGQLVQYRYPLVGDGEAPLIGEFLARIDASPSGPSAMAAGYGASSDNGVVTVRRSDFRPAADLVVDVQTSRAQNRARLYVAPPEQNSDAGSTVLLRTELPPAELTDGVTLAIVLDTSGSIEPALLDAERALVEALLAGLGARDRAVVLSADQTARPVGPETMGPVDAARRKAISEALAKLSPGGATDLGRALEAAADALPADAPAGMVVYVGDGWATLGDGDPEATAARLSRREAGAPRLSAIAVGPLANRRVLSALTRGSGPLYEIADSEDAANVAVELMSDALRPALANVEVDMGAEVDQVYPRTPRAIAAGETLSAVGRIRGPAPKSVIIRYRDARGSHEEVRAVDVLRAEDPSEVRRRWAAERVEEIVLRGKGREAATDVALKAGLVTPWTALRVGGSGEYIARAFETRVLDLSSDGQSLVGPVLSTGSDLTGTLAAFDQESAGAASLNEALESAATRVLDDAAPAVRACRDSRAALKPELSGALEVAFAIDGDGLPHDVGVKGVNASSDDDSLNRCVKLVVEGLRFPRGGTGRVKVSHLIQLPPAPASLGPRKCSDVSRLPMPLRRGVWWTRLTQGEPSAVYVQAKRQCELATWTDRRALLELMLIHRSDGVARVDLANRLGLLGEPDAAALMKREAVRRVRSPDELSNVRRALLGSERYPGNVFEEKYKAAAGDQERLDVVRRFLELAPHDSRLRRRLLALLEALNRPAEIAELARQLRSDPFADALLLADAASALHRSGADAEARRTFGELSERAPKDPWVRGLLGDRLRAEGWFDDASEAYATLEQLVPEDARATLRSALAHAGAGRVDIAERLLTRVARTGGRSGDADFVELARQLGRILAEATLSSTSRRPSADEATRLRRLALELSQAETSSVILVRAEAAAPELKVRLTTSDTDKSLREPDIAVPSLGLYLFRSNSAEPLDKVLGRLSVTGPVELTPSRPIRLRVDALSPHPNAESPLVTRELTLPNDGKQLALGP
jgi:tetratricopeptide (TPR) repeat protein/Mg-chelatase subunit ChlD